MPASKQPPTSMYLDASVTVLFDRNATVALVSAYIGDELIEATGSAKREQGDVCNTDIAVNLAVGRAFSKLGKKMQRDGNSLVKDAMRDSAVKPEQTALTDPNSAIFTVIFT